MEQAQIVGEELAKRAKEKGITTVVMDRGGYIYRSCQIIGEKAPVRVDWSSKEDNMEDFQSLEPQFDERVIDIARVAKVVKVVVAFRSVSPWLWATITETLVWVSVKPAQSRTRCAKQANAPIKICTRSA